MIPDNQTFQFEGSFVTLSFKHPVTATQIVCLTEWLNAVADSVRESSLPHAAPDTPDTWPDAVLAERKAAGLPML